MNGINPFEYGMAREAANFQALTPLSFIERAASIYPDRLAIIHGAQRQTWAQTYRRCVRLASALSQRGIGLGDTVAQWPCAVRGAFWRAHVRCHPQCN